MQSETFAALAEPTRLRILSQLKGGERSVGELVHQLQLPQPAVSKHLKVLREAGFVSSRTVAQQRLYHIEVKPLKAVDAWLEPYRRLWTRHLDALERHLDRQEQS